MSDDEKGGKKYLGGKDDDPNFLIMTDNPAEIPYSTSHLHFTRGRDELISPFLNYEIGRDLRHADVLEKAERDFPGLDLSRVDLKGALDRMPNKINYLSSIGDCVAEKAADSALKDECRVFSAVHSDEFKGSAAYHKAMDVVNNPDLIKSEAVRIHQSLDYFGKTLGMTAEDYATTWYDSEVRHGICDGLESAEVEFVKPDFNLGALRIRGFLDNSQTREKVASAFEANSENYSPLEQVAVVDREELHAGLIVSGVKQAYISNVVAEVKRLQLKRPGYDLA